MTDPSMLSKSLPETLRIAFFGDSISEVGRSAKWHGGASIPEKNWCFLATGALQKQLGVTVVRGQYGIGGQNTYEGLGRLDVLEAFAPNLVVIAFGTNDCCYHYLLPEETHLALTSMVDQITERFSADVLVVGTGGDNPRQSFFFHLEETLAAQEQVAAKVKVPFVNVRAAILAATQHGENWADYHLASDNCHPNDRGHEVWAAALRPHLERWADPNRKTSIFLQSLE